MGDPLGSLRVALRFAPSHEIDAVALETMVFGPKVCRDRFAVSLVGLEQSFPDWGRNCDSEIDRASYDSFSMNGPSRTRARVPRLALRRRTTHGEWVRSYQH
ncbi:unnamed protein product [Musa textilis]